MVQPPPRSHPAHSLWRARFDHHEPPAPPEEYHMINPGGHVTTVAAVLWPSSLHYLLREGGGRFTPIFYPRETESDSWGWSPGMGNPPGGLNVSSGENLPQAARAAPGGIMPWLGEGHSHGSEGWLDICWSPDTPLPPQPQLCTGTTLEPARGLLLRTETRTLAVPLSCSYQPSS